MFELSLNDRLLMSEFFTVLALRMRSQASERLRPQGCDSPSTPLLPEPDLSRITMDYISFSKTNN